MENARVKFKEMFLLYFLPDCRILPMVRHYLRLQEVLSTYYDEVQIQNDEFMGDLPESDPLELTTLKIPVSGLLARKNTCEESWVLREYQTEISHLSGGIQHRSKECQEVSSEIAQALVINKIADIVVYSMLPQPKSIISSIFQTRSRDDISLIGNLLGIYLFLKIEAISPLHKKLRWKEKNESKPWFSKFLASLEVVFGNEGKEIITIPFNQLKSSRVFLKDCDSQILSRITHSDLQEMLVPTGIEINQWLAAKI